MEQSTWDSPDTVESFTAWFDAEIERFQSIEGKLNAVRRTHRQALLKIGVLDMVSGAPVEEITRRLSDLADACAGTVLDIVFDELAVDDTLPDSLAIIALGKLGGRELNYSSDIDVIFVTDDADDETMLYYTRVARRFTDAMSALTEEGTLYRVDLRLRPDGKAGPIVNSETALRLYYENRGRPWEFQALLKARAIAGDIELGGRLVDSLGKLIFNPALSYSPLESIGAMRDQIKERSPAARRGYNIKLMAGGIRDVEFVVQALQILHGGRHAELRSPNTLAAVAELRKMGLLREWDADNLAAAYRFFRLVEHRLQMMHQLQTHTLPDSDAEIALLARRVSQGPLGAFTSESFVETLSKHLNHVRTLADSFFAGEPVHPHSVLLMLPPESERSVAILEQYGVRDVPRTIHTLHAMAYGSYPRLLDRRARAAFEDLLPFLLEGAAAAGDPEQAIAHVAQIAEAGRSEGAFYRQLAESEPARHLVFGIAGMSSLVTREVCAQAGVLDAVLQDDGTEIDTMLAGAPEWERFSARDAGGGEKGDERRVRQRQWFERLRVFQFAECLRRDFQPGPHGRTGEIVRAGAARVELAHAFDQMIPERERVAVFALGSYAVGEPRVGSDLDLIVVADGVDLPDLMRRVQAVNRWFTEGRILKLDFRLRAEGASSPLVQDMEFYEDYFRARASLWERVAFAKCAPWWGGEAVRDAFQRLLTSFVARPFTHDEAVALGAVRRRVESLAPKQHVVWETKRSPGGRYDIEYIASLGLAATGADRPDRAAMGTGERVRALAAVGFITDDERAALEEAIVLFTMTEHLMELQEMTHPASDEKAERLARLVDRAMEFIGDRPAPTVERLLAAKAAVRRCYQRVSGAS
jgi:[glutamine synthetase] adenylyltransferase / [glutamine synthetase]-adenylyl-L-tyrosine phosphorylase